MPLNLRLNIQLNARVQILFKSDVSSLSSILLPLNLFEYYKTCSNQFDVHSIQFDRTNDRVLKIRFRNGLQSIYFGKKPELKQKKAEPVGQIN